MVRIWTTREGRRTYVAARLGSMYCTVSCRADEVSVKEARRLAIRTLLLREVN